MIRQAVIRGGGPAAFEPVLGIPAAARVVRTLRRCGVETIRVVDGNPVLAAALAELGVESAPADLIVATVAGPSLVCHADHVYSDVLIKRAMKLEVGDAELHRCGELYVVGPGRLAAALRGDFDSAIAVEVTGRGEFSHRIDGVPARKRAERDMIKALTKPVDGPIARHVIRPMSAPITRLLCPYNVNPNHMTIFAAVSGFVAVAFIVRAASHDTAMNLAIATGLMWTQVVFDHVDGELARLKFRTSQLGAWIDHVSDDALSTAYGLAFGWTGAAVTGEIAYWYLGIASCVAISLFHVVHYGQLISLRTGDPFSFRWWFQKSDEYVKTHLRTIGARITEGLHAMGRRDVYIFAFALFCLTGIPQAAMVWYFIVAMIHLVLSVLHLAAGGRPRVHAQRVP